METKEITKTTFDLAKPNQTLELANILANFIKEKNLSVKIQGKDYVKCEGWTFAGSQLGMIPIITSCESISNNGEYKYRSQVEIRRIADDKLMGIGIAICSNVEPSKKSFQEYAICSMSQTRAIGKAYRNLLAWLITAAGYSPTPAEEMDFVNGEKEIPKNQPKEQQDISEFIFDIADEINACNNRNELEKLWKGYSKDVQANKNVIVEFKRREKEFPKI